MTSMSIKNSKERTFWPIRKILFICRPSHIQDDGNSVLIIISHNSLICVCSIPLYNSISFYRALCRFKIWKLKLIWIRHMRTEEIYNLHFAVSCWLGFCLSLNFRLELFWLEIAFLRGKGKWKFRLKNFLFFYFRRGFYWILLLWNYDLLSREKFILLWKPRFRSSRWFWNQVLSRVWLHWGRMNDRISLRVVVLTWDRWSCIFILSYRRW